MAADLAVFSREEGRFTYVDSAQNRIEARMRLVPEYTIRGGVVVWKKA
jgi:predicted amidohydrolase